MIRLNGVNLISGVRRKKSSPRSKTVLNFINSNYEKDLNLNNTAAIININSSYLCRKFKKELGISFRKYLIKVRIQRAIILLSNTEKSIKEIGYEVGFNSPELFSKTFNRVMGSSPSEYRVQVYQ